MMENIHYLNNYCSRKKTRFNLSSCVMTTNAFELSNITQFANTLDCELFFTRVTYPRELSLETREASELEGIIKTIQTANLPVETERQQKNKTTLLNLASHLEFWKSQSLSSVKVENFAEYLHELKDYLKVNSKNESLELYNNIEEKLNYLLEIAKQNKLQDQAVKKIQEVPFKTLVEMVPGINKEHLLHLFQAYVMPIQN
ncbi:MAG: hypothetical protein IT236_01580 [Bacteroidia bacterium]|nr:hypothetical protein [Bacteroidia bacterium]